ncbi:hypothetical protein FD755_008422 [Muntiacus reevesi]|uniref:Uncharacterized protein n=1 Tax=Muntiacus reevesi TaxID=9886 RepID=A0A5J5MPG4_MUNRE|nr:hypothetical protein FD755_008422 [Muntiacus reevesi]
MSSTTNSQSFLKLINLLSGAVVTEPVPKMRTRRELEPKGPKPASPSALGANSNISQQPATVTFSPVDIHVEAR